MPDDHASSREPSPIGVGKQEVAARRVRVLLPLPLPEALDYLAPELPPPEPGSFVHVPLGQRTLAGVVWDGVGDELPEERLEADLRGILNRDGGTRRCGVGNAPDPRAAAGA
jgi:primosomal protein N' (replication factor Y)